MRKVEFGFEVGRVLRVVCFYSFWFFGVVE